MSEVRAWEEDEPGPRQFDLFGYEEQRGRELDALYEALAAHHQPSDD